MDFGIKKGFSEIFFFWEIELPLEKQLDLKQVWKEKHTSGKSITPEYKKSLLETLKSWCFICEMFLYTSAGQAWNGHCVNEISLGSLESLPGFHQMLNSNQSSIFCSERLDCLGVKHFRLNWLHARVSVVFFSERRAERAVTDRWLSIRQCLVLLRCVR